MRNKTLTIAFFLVFLIAPVYAQSTKDKYNQANNLKNSNPAQARTLYCEVAAAPDAGGNKADAEQNCKALSGALDNPIVKSAEADAAKGDLAGAIAKANTVKNSPSAGVAKKAVADIAQWEPQLAAKSGGAPKATQPATQVAQSSLRSSQRRLPRTPRRRSLRYSGPQRPAFRTATRFTRR
jgi:hypothetical protein